MDHTTPTATHEEVAAFDTAPVTIHTGSVGSSRVVKGFGESANRLPENAYGEPTDLERHISANPAFWGASHPDHKRLVDQLLQHLRSVDTPEAKAEREHATVDRLRAELGIGESQLHPTMVKNYDSNTEAAFLLAADKAGIAPRAIGMLRDDMVAAGKLTQLEAADLCEMYVSRKILTADQAERVLARAIDAGLVE